MLATTPPLAMALRWKNEARIQSDILDGLGRDPSHEKDVAGDAYMEARREYRRIIEVQWRIRCMARGYLPGNAPRTAVYVNGVKMQEEHEEAA